MLSGGGAGSSAVEAGVRAWGIGTGSRDGTSGCPAAVAFATLEDGGGVIGCVFALASIGGAGRIVAGAVGAGGAAAALAASAAAVTSACLLIAPVMSSMLLSSSAIRPVRRSRSAVSTRTCAISIWVSVSSSVTRDGICATAAGSAAAKIERSRSVALFVWLVIASAVNATAAAPPQPHNQ